MPEHLRSLIVILLLAATVFALAHRTVGTISEAGDYTRRRNLWLALTLAAFLAQNFWLYTLITIVLLIYSNRREYNPPALFFFLMFVIPYAIMPIPGMGLINYFFSLSYLRILALVILLPVFFSLRRENENLSFGRCWPDKALAAYLVLTVILDLLRGPSVTDTLRQVFYIFVDIFLPYFVISRSLKNMQVFRDAILSLVLAMIVIALIAAVEFYKHWLLYVPLIRALDLQGMGGYLGRDGMLRAVGPAGQAIALGYLMTVGLGLYLFVQRYIQHNLIRRSGIVLLIIGLIVSLSSGPWVGAAVLLLVFIATGRNLARRLMSLSLAAMLALPLLAVIPGGERMINLLPFVGTTETGNVDYRADLFTNSMIVIQRNPWFGSNDSLKTPEMEAMRQGEGIIDIVNSYLSVALETGFVGLGLFVGFFVMALVGIFRAMRSISDKASEEYLLGRALLSTLLAILIIISTVSSITIIPIVYWIVAGMGVAYAQMVRKSTDRP